MFVASTAAMMAAVPEGNSGLGSAINNLTRQVGGAMGVAVLGSLLTSIYSNKITPAVADLPGELAATARDNVSAAVQAAASLDGVAGDALRDAATIAFMDGLGVAMLTGAGAALAGALLLLRFMPARDLPSSR